MKLTNALVLSAWLLCTVPSGFVARDASVDQILAKLSETYRGLRNYQLVAEVSEEVASVGEARSPNGSRAWSNFHHATSSDVDLAVVEPGKFRLQVKDEVHEVLLVSDGVTMWMYLPKKSQYTEQPVTAAAALGQSREDTKVGAESAQNNQAYFLNLLVLRYRDLSRFSSSFALEKETQIKVGKEKIDCYGLKMETKDGVHELWVDKNRFIVWRSRDASPTPQEGITLQKTTTVNLRSVTVNLKMDDSLFTFTPPEKATKVEPPKIK